MNKSDLKVGYLVRYRNGSLRMVMPVEECDFVFVGEDGSWMGCEDYDEQLTCNNFEELDVVEIYGFSKHANNPLKTETSDRKLLWERQDDKKEMTIQEIEKELGYSIKIVKEK